MAFLIEDSSGEIFKILRRVGNFSFSKLSEGVGMGSEACVLKLDGFFLFAVLVECKINAYTLFS